LDRVQGLCLKGSLQGSLRQAVPAPGRIELNRNRWRLCRSFLRIIYTLVAKIALLRFRVPCRCAVQARECLHGRPSDGGADRCLLPGDLGSDQVLRAFVSPGVNVMLWFGLIVTVGLLVYLGVALFDAENF
jgi:K+-transporting ATPase KdpF subunit